MCSARTSGRVLSAISVSIEAPEPAVCAALGVVPVASSRDVAASLLHTAVAAAERCRGLVNDTGVSSGVRPSESHPHS